VRSSSFCEVFTALTPSARRRIVEEALSLGYAVKDVAYLMGVSPSAVSRYVHGTLIPSPNSLCRLLISVEGDTRDKLLRVVIVELWKALRRVVEYVGNEVYLKEVVEYLADEVSKLVEELHK